MRESVSRLNVEKVVNPPITPVVANSFQVEAFGAPPCWNAAESTPIRKQPAAFTRKVGSGNDPQIAGDPPRQPTPKLAR